MPIAQQRLIDLIEACDDCLRLFDKLQNLAMMSLDQCEPKAQHALQSKNREELFSALLETLYSANGLKNAILENGIPTKSLLTLERERTHFKSARKRNDKARQYISTRRVMGLVPDSPQRREQQQLTPKQIKEINEDILATDKLREKQQEQQPLQQSTDYDPHYDHGAGIIVDGEKTSVPSLKELNETGVVTPGKDVL